MGTKHENLDISIEAGVDGRKAYVCWVNKDTSTQTKLSARNLSNLLAQVKEYLRNEYDMMED